MGLGFQTDAWAWPREPHLWGPTADHGDSVNAANGVSGTVQLMRHRFLSQYDLNSSDSINLIDSLYWLPLLTVTGAQLAGSYWDTYSLDPILGSVSVATTQVMVSSKKKQHKVPAGLQMSLLKALFFLQVVLFFSLIFFKYPMTFLVLV